MLDSGIALRSGAGFRSGLFIYASGVRALQGSAPVRHRFKAIEVKGILGCEVQG